MGFPDVSANDLICLRGHFTKINSLLQVTSSCQYIVYNRKKEIKLILISFSTKKKKKKKSHGC